MRGRGLRLRQCTTDESAGRSARRKANQAGCKRLVFVVVAPVIKVAAIDLTHTLTAHDDALGHALVVAFRSAAEVSVAVRGEEMGAQRLPTARASATAVVFT